MMAAALELDDRGRLITRGRMNQKTKKFPVSLGQEGCPTHNSEFLVPKFFKTDRNVFVGLKSGKETPLGAISFIGVEIDAQEVLSKLKIPPPDLKQALRLLENYLTQLQKFKIGNIISIVYETNGGFYLKKEAERAKINQNIHKLV